MVDEPGGCSAIAAVYRATRILCKDIFSLLVKLVQVEQVAEIHLITGVSAAPRLCGTDDFPKVKFNKGALLEELGRAKA